MIQDGQANQAGLIVELMQNAVSAPDITSAVSPILEYLVDGTGAVGAIFFQDCGDVHIPQVLHGLLPEGPVLEQIKEYGLPAETPLMVALKESPQPFFFGNTEHHDTTTGFPELGVASLAAAPIRDAHGVFVGAVVLHTFDHHNWDASEANLLASIAGAPGTLIARLVVEEQALRDRDAAVRAIGVSLELRGQEPVGHIDRVVAMALDIGERMDLTNSKRHALRWGAVLHDIGKAAIPDAILLKPVELDEEEWNTIRQHPERGEAFAADMSFLPESSLSVIRHHHEQWDGHGYPDGLSGDDISLLARIVAVCDVYDALISNRPFRDAWEPDEALREVESQAGRKFDPAVVEAFLDAIRDS